MSQLLTESLEPIKTKPKKQLKDKIKNLRRVVNTLEISFTAAEEVDRKFLVKLRGSSVKMSSMENRLKQVMQENEQLLDTVHLRSSGSNLGISTISLVHLQYKYDELASAHNTLLKILELRNKDLKKLEEYNLALEEKLHLVTAELEECQAKSVRFERKLAEVKRKKKEKTVKFKRERYALAMVHDRLIALLHKQCLEKNDAINQQLKLTQDGNQGLLFQEIRKNNLLSYENFRLQQEVGYLKAFLQTPPERSLLF
ncbi:hypothetical protein GWI33_016665 [Rhynchophorus ferrugineus]|uniref:Uncharacterized protein n=1 Tax=Rhynchophorus ferrugineus TaxID=354439 RepID=A0A834I0R1_RHYFE|nr:hypothetical protein GWI33_016665 [Rhynchophorus ferrugineus]